MDIDWINDAGKPLLLAVPPRKAAELAVAIAEATDRKVEALTDDLVSKNAAAGSPLNLSRADHRRQHLDDIERALKAYRKVRLDAACEKTAAVAEQERVAPRDSAAG